MSGRRRLKRKELECYLQEIEVFENPKVLLEQYPTTPHIAACMLHTIDEMNDVEDKIIGDLGVGCGILSIGTAMLGASYVVGFDIDDEALAICHQNMEDFEIENFDLVQMDIESLVENCCRFSKKFDTIVMNPPFGTKHNAGMDVKFLKVGLEMSRNSVYSLHKTSTRTFLQKKCEEWDVNMEVIAELRFNLSKTMKCHKRNSVDIEVDFIRLTHKTGKS